MYGSLQQELAAELEGLREARLFKAELELESPQSPHVRVAGMGEMLNLCANNYLGLADHPEIGSSAARRPCTGSSRNASRRSSGRTTRSSSARASTPTEGSSRRCSARATP